MEGWTKVEWTQAEARKFQKRYRKAAEDKEESFKFMVNGQDTDFDTGYAKYLIEYMKMRKLITDN